MAVAAVVVEAVDLVIAVEGALLAPTTNSAFHVANIRRNGVHFAHTVALNLILKPTSTARLIT